jgi:uncharacterized protein (UPF0332 family)
MKEWERHLDRAEEKLRSASILFEHKMFADAISETYYSMFHAAKALLALRGLFSKTHAGVVSQFGLQFISCVSGSVKISEGEHLQHVERGGESPWILPYQSR